MKSSALEDRFALLWRSLKGPSLEREYVFIPGRRFRFDFAHVESKTAVEIEGGVWMRGRHQRPQGFINDCAKYNLAAADGWAVFRLTDEQITEEWLRTIKARMKA